MKTSAPKPAAKGRVLVSDDHPFLRLGLSMLLNRQSDLCCCGEADSVAGTRKLVGELKPDLLLLDLFLGDGDGLELIKSLRAQHPATQILVISQLDEAVYAERALRAGACGYVMKEQPPEEVLAALRAVLAGELYVSRKMAAAMLRKTIQTKAEARGTGVECLTDRELQVFRSLGTGLTTRQIAAELNLSFKTIETYRENIKHKLALTDAPALVRMATEWVQSSTAMPTRKDLPAAKRARR